MTDNKEIVTGWYMLSNQRAHCIVREDGLVRVFYENNNYTCANLETFKNWLLYPNSYFIW